MRRILHITSSLDRNGTETFIMNVYRHIDRNRIQFDFLLFTQSTEGYYQEAEELGARIYRIPPRRNGFFSYCKNLYVFFKHNAVNYAGIHFCACSLTTILPVVYAMCFGIPIRIIHSHNTSWEGIHNYILHKINRLIIPFVATDFWACSKGAERWFYLPFVRKRSVVIKNGIDIKKFSYKTLVRNEVRKELGLVNEFVIGHVGRFSAVKNHAFLLELMQNILRYIPDAKLVLVGEGELKDHIEEQAKAMKIDEHILFLGLRSDVYNLLQAFDCFILPSLFEGLPFVLLEAQCSGLKVLTSDVVSTEARVTDNIYFLNLSGNMSEWIELIKSFIKYPRKDESSIIEKKGYSIEKVVEYISSVYLR